MFDDVQDVVFRHCEEAGDEWEAYALSYSAYGFGESLSEARKDIVEALALLLGRSEDSIELNEYHERLLRAANERHADVWLRAHQDVDSNRILLCWEVGNKISDLCYMLCKKPEEWCIFDNGLSLNGDIIVLACLPDDMLDGVFKQVTSDHRLYLAVAYPERVYFRCINTNEATDRKPESEVAIASLNLGTGATVDDFIQATNVDHNHNIILYEEYLVA